jgi:UDP-glucose 4-epimerase
MKILVTGGAGYIGSHVVRQLSEAGHDVVVLDNLSTGHEWAVLGARLVKGDLGDAEALEKVFSEGDPSPGAAPFDAVMHFAASIVVPESVSEPLKYYRNNTVNLISLLEVCTRHRVPRFVFSSTAAVYGMPPGGRVSESSPLAPISPYGASKAMSERILMDAAAATGLRYVILRYFNVAGADPQGRIGQASRNATHLIKVACEAALGQRPEMPIYGTDYPTRDGTCIRDYIHVDDLARAHLAALDHLSGGGDSEVLNCGYGHGHTVREVIEAVRRASGRTFAVREAGRRAGDPVELVADSDRIRRLFGWQPRHDDLDFIVKTAWDWELKRAGN